MTTHLGTQPEIIINVNTQREGYIFGLRPRSRVWLETNYPERVRVFSVFIGLDKIMDLRQLPENILGQVVNLITGLSLDELQASGGFRLYNPTTGEEVVNPLVAYV
jgi:hypothetical protein